MKLNKLKNIIAVFVLLTSLMSCGNDDNTTGPEPLDFSGTFEQEDQMGRPGINTVLSGSSSIKDDFNITVPSEQGAKFQPLFLDQAVALHAAFGVEYENNILGLDATTLTTILASDVLQVAPGAPTTYFDGTNILTGRRLTDDVIDISLILIFGGQNGDRFNGQDIDNDGTPDLPILVTDGVSSAGETPLNVFPYLEAPHSL
ncbi:DUF4331 domain-containing protein [Aquimarina sp. AD10]|uniref:DUF4331 domain-containing protein n=1 Tax=Aquimarina aggregata TaxID=1642818 RepID=A0A162XQZ8_9FLAO|nr:MULTISPECIES: DUF4331 family protein [Aquimarina]AXT60299.1 DUF4331 domain-containing protein [Aquimarina sp. AD10]KZS38736.1 hypothetical protein AWE51_14205 [Aquimarina aggregata]RKN01266.1 DUF4331 domain-containing protein [Aquimarina sp. AD10]